MRRSGASSLASSRRDPADTGVAIGTSVAPDATDATDATDAIDATDTASGVGPGFAKGRPTV